MGLSPQSASTISPIYTMSDSQTEAGGFIRELRELARVSTTAAARERYLRSLYKGGYGTRVLEDKAGGIVIEAINARGGFGTMGATRAIHMAGGNRCYRDASIFSQLVRIAHWGVRDWQGSARRSYLMARAEVLRQAQ